MPTAAAFDADRDRQVPNRAFGAGEKLVFDIEFLGINAGRASLEIAEIVPLGSARAFRLIADSRTNSFFDKVYKVRNRYESFIDIDRLCSWRYIEHQVEKGTTRERVSAYDQFAHTAVVTTYPKQKKGKDASGKAPKVETVEVPPYVQDVLSAIYYLRTQDLQVGQVYRLPTISGLKNYELVVTIPRKTTVKTPLGKFEALELIPEIKYEGLFVSKGQSYVYLSNDAKKMPLMLKSKVAVGSFKAVLVQKQIQDYVTSELPPPPSAPGG